MHIYFVYINLPTGRTIQTFAKTAVFSELGMAFHHKKGIAKKKKKKKKETCNILCRK